MDHCVQYYPKKYPMYRGITVFSIITKSIHCINGSLCTVLSQKVSHVHTEGSLLIGIIVPLGPELFSSLIILTKLIFPQLCNWNTESFSEKKLPPSSRFLRKFFILVLCSSCHQQLLLTPYTTPAEGYTVQTVPISTSSPLPAYPSSRFIIPLDSPSCMFIMAFHCPSSMNVTSFHCPTCFCIMPDHFSCPSFLWYILSGKYVL